MQSLDRRRFVQTLTVLGLGAPPAEGQATPAAAGGPAPDTVRVERRSYIFEWEPEADRLRLLDRKGREMMRSPMQPAVVVASAEGKPRSSPGRVAGHRLEGDRLRITYEGVNGAARLSVAWRFGNDGLWLDPVIYEGASKDNVVALHYFAEGDGDGVRPALDVHYTVLPGISVSSALSPIRTPEDGLDLTAWLGHGDDPGPGPIQGWALPVHYFCGLRRNAPYIASRGALSEHLSDAFCCGLASLPQADLLFRVARGRGDAILDFRGDLWKHLQGPGRLALGSTWHLAIGENYYEAIRAYYRGLVEAGIVSVKRHSAAKTANLLTPQFNTWGEAVAVNKPWDKFDEPVLTGVYEKLRESGLRPGMFVIDAKWEGTFGSLEHDHKRFPHFEQIVERIRDAGYRIGLWAAFLRCEKPQDLGLSDRHMLRAPEGGPFAIGEGPGRYYILDMSQPEVQRTAAERARRFVRRYRPDLVKIDFGYEIPSLGRAAPRDMSWAGERFFKNSLRVVVGAMREVNPDIVIFYDPLSPLFGDEIDQFTLDDLAYCPDDYALEANRRIFFSSLLGELGMPTHGSSGYDWASAPGIWFDSAVTGTLGCLVSLSGDPYNRTATPEIVAKYNGLARILRPVSVFSVVPIGADYVGSVRGARSPSWVRLEEGKLVLAALRTGEWNGARPVAGYRGLVSASASVVVASKTDGDLATTARLGIVPYGEGTLTLKRREEAGIVAEVREHYSGGGSGKRQVTVKAGSLEVPLRERNGASLVEWVEVVFS